MLKPSVPINRTPLLGRKRIVDRVRINVAPHNLRVSDNGSGITAVDIGVNAGAFIVALADMSFIDLVSRPQSQDAENCTIFKGGKRIFYNCTKETQWRGRETTASAPICQKRLSEASASKNDQEVDKVKRAIETTTLATPCVPFIAIDTAKDAKVMICRKVDTLMEWITASITAKDGTRRCLVVTGSCVVDKILTQDLIKDTISLAEEGGYSSHREPLGPENSLDGTPDRLRCMSGCPRGILEIGKSKACISDIVFDQELNQRQCEESIRNLGLCTFPFQCAHGTVPLDQDVEQHGQQDQHQQGQQRRQQRIQTTLQHRLGITLLQD
ncbi:hypothetical protein B0O80DRAFT_501537 [Mortierella sp. GBAus27b]|nr:hypothetical protein B0O80DRAFT_501537 [Mortierella sp. GBAus27b]